MNRLNRSDKPYWVPPRSIKLLDQVRERIRCLHNSLQTEKDHVYRVKAFVLWAARMGGSFRHPRDMRQTKAERYLTLLATEKRVSPATHRQALNALLFLYRQVLGLELPWLEQFGRPPERKRIPVVLTVQGVPSVLGPLFVRRCRPAVQSPAPPPPARSRRRPAGAPLRSAAPAQRPARPCAGAAR